LHDPLGGQEYAYYYLLLSHWKAGHSAEAMGFCRQLQDRFPSSPLTTRVEQLEAEGYRRVSTPWLACRAYEKLIAERDSPDLRLSYGEVLESLDRLTEAHGNYQALRKKWPRSAEGREAKKRIRMLEEQLPRLKSRWKETRGLREEEMLAMQERNWPEALSLQEKLLSRTLSSSLHRQVLVDRIQALVRSGKLDGAREEQGSLLRQYPRSREAARALYTVGRGFWRKDRNAEARPLLERLVDDYTDSELAAPASYILGRIHLEGGDLDLAIRWFRYTRFLFPWTEWEREAAWWEAWSLYRAGRYGACAEFLEALESGRVWIPELVPRSRYWQSRSLDKAGNRARSRLLYGELLQRFPTNYYGLLARSRLEEGAPPPSSGDAPARRPDVSGPDPDPGAPGLYGTSLMLQDPVLPLLLEAGLQRDAVERLDWLRQGPGGAEVLETEDWIVAYSRAGDLVRALRAAYRGRMHDRILKEGLFGEDERSVRLLRNLYPLYHWEQIRARAEEHGLDPYLVAGLIRQESLFQADILSPAGAMGLMQIMPATGSRMAKELGMKDFKTSRLLDPEVNIHIGTAYLAELTDRYGSDWNKILANYNAGPRPVAKWTEVMPEAEPDEFVENIRYRETRLYVKKVVFNRDLYRRLYER
jgi:soluble lytic murein transglycosylase